MIVALGHLCQFLIVPVLRRRVFRFHLSSPRGCVLVVSDFQFVIVILDVDVDFFWSGELWCVVVGCCGVDACLCVCGCCVCLCFLFFLFP